MSIQSASGFAVAPVDQALRWADFYRSRGFNPLPSRTDAKRPLVRFAQWWDTPAPADLFGQHPTTNLQVMTGRRWRLLVLDLDGPEARGWYLERARSLPSTWITHSGGGGLHLWFRIPPDLPPMPKAFLWRGEGEHSAVERLCDRSLVMAPPSIHPKTGRRYQFLSKGQSPARHPMPAACPAWILSAPAITPPAPALAPVIGQRMKPEPVTAGRFRRADVLDAIGDKLALAESWGLRVASRRPNGAGWCSCHAIGREDRTPSASISASSGRYWEPGERTITLFELAVRLGAYLDWRDAVADLGRRFGVREVA